MKAPDDVALLLRTRWNRQWPEWLGGGGTWPQRFALSAPDEASARRDWPRFTAWLQSWRDTSLGHVERALRRWPAMGAQEVPTHVRFDSPLEFATALGATEAALFARAEQRWRARSAEWPGAADALRRIAEWLGACSEEDYGRWVSVVNWLAANPASGLRLRQLPVPGIHSKWVEVNTTPIGQVLGALRGVPAGVAFAEVAGLVTDPPRRRIRVLDATLRAQLGGLFDISLGLPELVRLSLPLRAVLIVENLQTALAFDDLPGVLLLFGAGYAVAETGALPWMGKVPVFYWGDIDNAGFGILHALRSQHPHTRSLLMDEETLLRHRSLWSHDESKPGPVLATLSAPEQALYEKLGKGDFGPAVRLEQERVDWGWAQSRVRAALGG